MLKWKRISFDYYDSTDGKWRICRLASYDNKYSNRDEWILSVRNGATWEGVDVYPLLREAKAAADASAEKQ